MTRGAKTTDNTVTWQECTGQAALNGDLTNTATWAQVKTVTPAVLGQVIKRSNNASYQICTTAGAMSASEPSFSDTAGVTTTDTTAVWTSLGVVGNFTGGQAPHARLVNACAATWFAAGNTFYVGDNHAEIQNSSMTITPTVNTATVSRILCHNHSGSYPPTTLTTGAAVSTSSAQVITFNPSSGSIYVFGLMFQITGVGATGIVLSSGNAVCYFDKCVFKIATTSPSNTPIQIGGNAASVFVWNNTTIYVSGTACLIQLEYLCSFTWQNTGQILASGSSIPAALLGALFNGRVSTLILEALDLSQLTGNLLNQNTPFQMGSLLVKDCKLNASMAVATPVSYGQIVQFVRCDSSGAAYKSARYAYEGTETTETTIVRTGGAVDPTGQAQSRKIVTTANAQWLRPYKAEPLAIWNPTVGSPVTVTVCGTVQSSALPYTDELWMEVEYLSDASSTLGTIVSTTKANLLAGGSPVAVDSSVWGIPPVFPLDTIANVTGAWSFGRNLLTSFGSGTRYTKSSGSSINALNDQSGNSRHFVISSVPAQPFEVTAFPANVLCADFDGVDDYMALSGFTLTNLITASSGAVVVSVIIDAVTLNNATSFTNHGIIADFGQYFGLFARNLSGVTFQA